MSQWTTRNMPDLHGKTALITGANSGLGLETTRALAAAGARVLMACRNTSKAKTVREQLLVAQPDAALDVVPLDLGDLASVRTLADKLHADDTNLDLLINNAGVMAVPQGATKDGFETQIGTNHLGHFALTGLLRGRLNPGARVVTLASQAHRWTPGIDLDDLHWQQRRYRRWQAYGDSKLANLLFCFAFDRRLRAAGSDVLSVAAHPGYADTHLQLVAAEQKKSRLEAWTMKLGNLLLAQSAERGALPSLYAATAPDVAGGDYFGPDGFQQMRGFPTRVGSRRAARDEALAERLWALSESLTGVSFDG